MNLTNFFAKWLRPLLANPKVTRGYFPKTFDKNIPSYFIVRKNCRMTRQIFELGSQMSPAILADSLCRFWQGSGDSELEPLAKPLAELAQSVYSIKTQDEEVSPFIYVMY